MEGPGRSREDLVSRPAGEPARNKPPPESDTPEIQFPQERDTTVPNDTTCRPPGPASSEQLVPRGT